MTLSHLTPITEQMLWKVKKALSSQMLPAIANGFAFCTRGFLIDLAGGKEVEKMTLTLPIDQVQMRDIARVDVVDGTLIVMMIVTWSDQAWYD